MSLIQNLLSFLKSTPPVDTAALRTEFKQRYRDFKALIVANNNALEVMTELEQAQQGQHPFGMVFIRSRCAAVSTHVLNIIEKLTHLAPGRYKNLTVRFNQITAELNGLLVSKKEVSGHRLVIDLKEVDQTMTDLVGGKMANLGELKNTVGLNVPGGFVITAFAYQHFMAHNDLEPEINARIRSTDLSRLDALYTLSAHIEQLILSAKIPLDLETVVTQAWRQMEIEAGVEITAALRSSALGEDGAGASFAGMHRSELNISAASIFQTYKEIVASKYSPQAIEFRLQKGLKDEDILMCVGCLVMIDAASGGVVYSGNPSSIHDDHIYVNATWGLPKAVVDGRIDNDLFIVSRAEPRQVVREEIHDKAKKFVCYPMEGICRLDSSVQERTQPSLTHMQVLALAEAAIAIETHYGVVQDIEWAIDPNGELYILQCRPLQQKEPLAVGPESRQPNEKESVVMEGGRTANPGAVSGRVFVAQREADILSFPDGAILVTFQALPRWALLLSRAAGVITERGGVAGHLASVAREFGIPALFGLSGVTERLHSGELITLDADAKAVHQGRVDALLEKPMTRPMLMAHNPVMETLQQAGKLITPLNLLDPHSSEFNPRNCQTLHDITRFAHEKAVKAMFAFGKDQKFSKWVSKQLYVNAPMQWWIINLDDGFNKEVPGKYVQLEDIASKPMLAFWEGFTAVPWAGPPALDGKGFMSVMFQSTRKPLLAHGLRTGRKDSNYFMIARDYCHLNSRLGYHFSTLETVMNDKLDECYIKFQFRGGAADYERRVKRILLIGELLDRYDFRVNVQEDNLTARVDGYDQAFTRHRLNMLGYLSLHTRQVDMIMANETAVKRYKNKFINDINSIISKGTQNHQKAAPRP